MPAKVSEDSSNKTSENLDQEEELTTVGVKTASIYHSTIENCTTVEFVDSNQKMPQENEETAPAQSSASTSNVQPSTAESYTINATSGGCVTSVLPVTVGLQSLHHHQAILMQSQIIPSPQVPYKAPAITGSRAFVGKERSTGQHSGCPGMTWQTFGDPSFCQSYSWQYQPTWTIPHQQLYHQDARYRYCQAMPSVNGDVKMYGMSDEKRSPQHFYSFNTRQDHTGQSSIPSASYQAQESYYSCNCPVQLNPSSKMVRQDVKASGTQKQSNIPGSDRIQHNRDARTRAKDNTTKQYHATRLPENAAGNETPQKSPTTSFLTPSCGTTNREWRHRDNQCSSDSGWISDTSCSSKEDDNAIGSPVLSNSLGDRLENVLQLENRVSSSSFDENYQESQFSSISSQNLSLSDENEHLPPTPVKRTAQQSRPMKAIPVRFMNLLHAAAEHVAKQRKRLEGCPLIRQQSTHHSNYDGQYNDYMFVQDIHQTEVTGVVQPQVASWYVPGEYVQGQREQNPQSFGQNQNQQNLGSYIQGHYLVQSPGSFLPNSSGWSQPNLGYQTQNQLNQSHESCTKSPDHSGIFEHLCGGLDYYNLPHSPIPLYVIPVESMDLVNGNCVMYNSAYAAPNAAY